MKITDLQTVIVGNPWKRWVFLRLETSNGLYGVAEATAYLRAEAVVKLLDESKRFYIGKDPLKVERLWHEWYRNIFYRQDYVMMTALSAIEVACWDIIGKHLGAPIHALLGGALRDRLKAYANGWYTHVKTPDEWAEKARQVVRKGYRALKFDPFGTTYLTADVMTIKRAITIVAAIREAVGDDVELLIEGHGRFNSSLAIRIARFLEPYQPSWFEEPVPPEDLEGLRKVKASTTIPIAAGERAYTKWGFTTLIQERLIDVAQPDPINAGGILETRKIATLAEANLIEVAPHNAEGPINTAICTQLDAVLPNFKIQETFDEFDVPWRREVVRDPIKIEDGYLHVPQRPGLGIDIDFEKAKEHPGDAVEDFILFEEGWEDRRL